MTVHADLSLVGKANGNLVCSSITVNMFEYPAELGGLPTMKSMATRSHGSEDY